MREIPDTKPYSRKEVPPEDREDEDKRKKRDEEQRKEHAEAIKERVTVKSLLSGPDGKRSDIKIAVMQDGCARQINFWDLDKTLLKAEPIHKEAIKKMFPDAAKADPEELMHTFVAGWRLGNSYREWDRMHRIYTLGQTQYKDAKVYREEFVDNKENCEKLDNPGHAEQWHENSTKMLEQYDAIACEAADRLFVASESGPATLSKEDILIGPVVHLLQAKVKRGELNVFMTANPREFAERLVRYSDLAQYGFALATDENLVGGGKEVGIEYLMDLIKKSGINIPTDRLVAIGDSIRGDVGAGHKFAQKRPGQGWVFEGVLIQKDSSEDKNLKEELEKASQERKEKGKESDLLNIFEQMNVTVVTSDNVRQVDGHYKLGRMGSVVKKEEPQEKSSS